MDKNKKQKKETRAMRRREEERLTNWYMINLCWSIFGIIALYIIQKAYSSASNTGHITAYEITLWSIAGAAVIGAAVLFVLGAKGVIKNKSRARNYGIFLLICAASSAWVVSWRVYLRALVAKIFGTSSVLYTGSFWGIWLLMMGCVIWIVVAFIIYIIKAMRLKKK